MNMRPPSRTFVRNTVSLIAVLAGVGFLTLGWQWTGSFMNAINEAIAGAPDAPGLMLLVVGTLFVLYGGGDLLFRLDDNK